MFCAICSLFVISRYLFYNLGMKLFYGANKLIRTPIFGLGSPDNDYGLGFYLTPEESMAALWASKFEGGGYSIAFDVDMKGLNVLYLDGQDETSVLRWITILVQFRFDKFTLAQYEERIKKLRELYYVDVSAYDVIVGYRADDSYFKYARDFLDNTLSIETLSEAMRLGKLGKQIVLKSKKAFERISFLSAEPVAYSDRYERFRALTLNQYKALKTTDKDSNTFIREILRGK